MYCTFGKDAIATTRTSCKTEVHTPQRKAKYSDRSRIRLKDIKRTALRDIGHRFSAEVKKYLQALGIKLDLRLTAAWVAIAFFCHSGESIMRIKLPTQDTGYG